MENDIAVIAENLAKNYGKTRALKGVSLEVGRGEVFGLIGPDGAGKSTLIRILATLMLPCGGSASVDGYDVMRDYKKIRSRIGYMPGRFSLYHDLSVQENLEFFASLFGASLEKNYHLVKDLYIRLEPFKKRPAGALSGGMKQKLALCCALIHKPSVLFLDEPTTGVDPVSRKEFWDILIRLKEDGITIIVSTPYMDEAKLCGRVALMKEGVFLKTDTPDNIVNGFGRTLLAVRGDDMYKILNSLRDHPGIAECFAFGDNHHVTIMENGPEAYELKKYLEGKNHNNVEVYPVKAGIEDCFLSLASGDEK